MHFVSRAKGGSISLVRKNALFPLKQRPFSSKHARSQGGGIPKKPSFSESVTSMFSKFLRPLGDPDVERMIAKAATIGVWGIGGLTVAGTLGIDTTPIVASIGVTGVAAGFATKKAASDLVSGILLVIDKPFRRGQHISLKGAMDGKGLHGIVEKVDWRYVVLRSGQGDASIVIPSSIVQESAIEIRSAEPLEHGSGTGTPLD